VTNPLSSATSNSHNLDTARSAEAVQTLRGAQTPGTKSAKIEKAAKNFESLLVGHWLEQAEKSFASVPGVNQDEQNDSSRDQFMSIACESLAQGLSKTGGFGIAAMISKHLQSTAEAAKSQPDQQGNPKSVESGNDNPNSIK
jgi:Rod binding domain-containing protein